MSEFLLLGAGSARSGRVWTPASQQNLELWLRPEDLPAVGELVTTWPDASGNSRDFEQSTAASKPVVVSGLGGHSAVEFDGVDDSLSFIGTTAGDFSLWIVFTYASGTGPQLDAIWSHSANGGNDFLDNNGVRVMYANFEGYFHAGTPYSSSNTISAGNTYTLRARWDVANTTIGVRLDDNAEVTNTHASMTNTGQNKYGLQVVPGTGRVYQYHEIIMSGNASAADEANVREYLNVKFGL